MEILGQPEFVHVAINHLPITGLFVALLCLVGALIFKSRSGLMLGLTLVSLTSLSVWPVYAYGQAAYDRVYSMADHDGGVYLNQHKQLAESWVWVYYVTATAAAGGILIGWKRPGFLQTAAIIVAVLALASLFIGAAISHVGGKVRHREFRTDAPSRPLAAASHGWDTLMPILDFWRALPPRAFPNYAAGSWGPAGSDDLLARDKREWRRMDEEPRQEVNLGASGPPDNETTVN